MANVTKNIYDKLELIIKTAYPRFTDADRIRVIEQSRVLKMVDFAYEDQILIMLRDAETLTTLSAGKISQYKFTLIYLNKTYFNRADEMSDFAEKLDQVFIDNVFVDNLWVDLQTTIDYENEIEIQVDEDVLPDFINKMQGFMIEIILSTYKGAS